MNDGGFFRSNRSESVDAEPLLLTTKAAAVEVQPPVVENEPSNQLELVADEPTATTILVISADEQLGKMFGTSLGSEPNTSIVYENNTLTDLKSETADFWQGYDIIVFETTLGNDLEMFSLRKVSQMIAPGTRLLAITKNELTLAFAKELMDAGVDEVLPVATVQPEIVEAAPVRSATPEGEDKDGAIIAIAQARGGIGATIVALGLAHCLTGACAKKKTPQRRVAFLDLDFQNGNAGAYVDVVDTGVVFDFLKAGRPAEASEMSAMMVPYSEHLHVLPSPSKFAPLNSLTVEMVANLLDDLRKSYDIIIVDMPRALVDWIEPILARADKMLMITDTSVTSVRQSRRLIDFYTDDHVSLPIEIVIGQEKKPFSLSDAQKEATKILERKFTYWLPRDDKAARKASDLGKPVTEAAARTPFGKALRSLSADIEKSYSEATRRRA